MKLIKEIDGISEVPLTFIIDRFDEATSKVVLKEVIEKSKEVVEVVTEAYKEDWTNHPQRDVRAVFGHWLVNAVRHFSAAITLCEGVFQEEHDLSVVVDVHHRQTFETYLQIRYYALLDKDSQKKYAKKIYAIGYIDYLEKISVMKDHEKISRTYKEISDKLSEFDKELIDEIMKEREKKIYNWFSKSFSQLAKYVSTDKEDLKTLYQIISAEVHGTWNFALDVGNSESGVLDFRGYPNKTTLFIRSAENLYQITNLYIKLWNVIAKSVGAEEVYYEKESSSG